MSIINKNDYDILIHYNHSKDPLVLLNDIRTNNLQRWSGHVVKSGKTETFDQRGRNYWEYYLDSICDNQTLFIYFVKYPIEKNYSLELLKIPKDSLIKNDWSIEIPIN